MGPQVTRLAHLVGSGRKLTPLDQEGVGVEECLVFNYLVVSGMPADGTFENNIFGLLSRLINGHVVRFDLE